MSSCIARPKFISTRRSGGCWAVLAMMKCRSAWSDKEEQEMRRRSWRTGHINERSADGVRASSTRASMGRGPG
ncbi:hypothetical protein B0H12DRAFT_1118734 [Mycena haematopus]|nr:hypothetical protein B0H12DRAFT_1118734 [Mycena haematopus]